MIYSVLVVYGANKLDKLLEIADTTFQQSIEINAIPMNEPLALKDIRFKFMFGLISNTFALPEINMDDYVQWNITLHQLEWKDGV